MESIDVEHSSAQVWYLDWGFSDLVDLRSLLLFPDEVWQYLPRALPCQLLADEISGTYTVLQDVMIASHALDGLELEH